MILENTMGLAMVKATTAAAIRHRSSIYSPLAIIARYNPIRFSVVLSIILGSESGTNFIGRLFSESVSYTMERRRKSI